MKGGGHVSGALRDRLLQPDLIEAFVEEYRIASEATRKAAVTVRAKGQRARDKLTGRIERLTDMMVEGIGDYAAMKNRLAAALAERTTLDRGLEDRDAVPEIAMHPNLAASYRRNVEKLTEALNAPELEAGEARQALRNLVELITAEPRADGRGVDLLVHGRLERDDLTLNQSGIPMRGEV